MTVQVRIFRPGKNAMQSGWGNSKQWVVELEPTERKSTDPLSGWVGSGDTGSQLRLKFPTKDEAIAYAERKGYGYKVWEPKQRVVPPKSYAANYAFDKIS